MWLKYLSILLVIFPNVNVGYEVHRDGLKTSNLPFRYELEQVTVDFQEKLRKELSKLEMEMYIEFLEFLQQIDANQTAATNDLTEELGRQVNTVLEKFTKVMVYSSERIENLKEKMNGLMTSLGSWVQDSSSALFNFNFGHILQEEFADTQETIIGRTKRHTGHVGTSKVVLTSQEISETKKQLEMDPDDFPIHEDDDIFTYLDSPQFDGQIYDSDFDFTLRETSPAAPRRYLIPKEQKAPQEVTEIPPRTDVLPRNCYDLLQRGNTQNGVYIIYPSGKGTGIEVWCDQTIAGGGWTVLLGRQVDSSLLNFTRTPIQYAHGFGTPSANHWIGLDIMHELTQGLSNTLRIHMTDYNNTDSSAVYNSFRVGNFEDDYILEVGEFDPSSTAFDALSPHSGRPFSYPLPVYGEGGCSQHFGVGWWYLEEPHCVQVFFTEQLNLTEGLEWETWPGFGSAFQSIQFMIRPSAVVA